MATDAGLVLDDAPVLGADTVVGHDRPGHRARLAKNAGWYVLLALLALVVLFPIWMTLVRALSQPIAYIEAGQPIRPIQPEWDVFSRAWNEGDLAGRFTVSFVTTIIITAAQVLTSLFAAYAFVFLRFPFRRALFLLFMTTLMLPIEVTLLVNVVTIRNLDWLNSYQGLTAPFLAAAFGTFLIRQGFLGIPKDLRDAAELDGLGHLGFLRNVAVPVTRPIIASFTLVAFLAAWNQYTWPTGRGHRGLLGDHPDRLEGPGRPQHPGAEHRLRRRHHRRRAHPDPAAGVPEAPDPRPHRRGGEGVTPILATPAGAWS